SVCGYESKAEWRLATHIFAKCADMERAGTNAGGLCRLKTDWEGDARCVPFWMRAARTEHSEVRGVKCAVLLDFERGLDAAAALGEPLLVIRPRDLVGQELVHHARPLLVDRD